MLIVEVKDQKNLDKALKLLKSKIIKTKQMDVLYNRREYKKKSVLRRETLLKATYKQRKKDNEN
jgi:small subunit ribosomal protein S21